MLAPPPRIWPAPPPAHVNGTAAATRYGYSSLAQILPSSQDKGDDQASHTAQQTPSTPLFTEEPVKLRKDSKHACTAADWRRKERGRVKIEPGLTPCQVQEVTTSSKHEQNGGIPVGIAVARQRVQQSTPPPLTVLTCEERSTNHVTGWTGPPSHWHYPGLDQNLPFQVPPLQLGRDPLSGQLLILPSGSIGESVQRTVLWPGGNGGTNSAPPPLVMPAPQPVLLDRFVTLAPQPQASSNSSHHQHEKRRTHDHSTTTTIHGGNSGGLTVGLFPPQPPPQTPFLMMPFTHQNNSLLLSTQLTEHNLNTMVVTNHQLSESAVLNPMEVITSPVDGFGGGSMIQQIPPSVVISHTETNSFVRSDINTVYPAQQVQAQPPQQHQQPNQQQESLTNIQSEQIVVKEENEMTEEVTEEEITEEETKAEVMDASNQTESPAEESDGEDIAIKEEQTTVVQPPSEDPASPMPIQEPDMSGLNLLCCVASADKETSKPLVEAALTPISEVSNVNEWSEEPDNISSGLGLLCTAAERLLEEEVEKVECPISDDRKIPKLTKDDDRFHKIDEEIDEEMEEDLSDMDQLSEISIQSTSKGTENSSEKRGEWYASNEKDPEKELLKIKIKRRPGRPRKKAKIMKKQRSPNSHEPPVLQPWSVSVNEDTYPLGSPPTLTPHKRKLSNDLSQESDEGSSSSSGHPPPLSPACTSTCGLKKRKVGRPRKSCEPSEKSENILPKPTPSSKEIVGMLMSSKHQDLQQSSGSQNKIKPKLKAEAKVKEWCDDEELDLSPGKENELDDEPLLPRPPIWQCSMKPKSKPISPPRKPKVKIVEPLKIENVPENSLPLRTIIKSPKSPSGSMKSPQSQSKSPQRSTTPPIVSLRTPLTKVITPHWSPESKESSTLVCPLPQPKPQTSSSFNKEPANNSSKQQSCITPKLPISSPEQLTDIALPKNVVASPKHTVTSPKNSVASPKHTVTSPKNTVASPKHTVTSPKNTVASPKHTVTSPKNTVASPKHTVTSPKNTVALPKNYVTPSKPQPTVPIKNNLSPKHQNNPSLKPQSNASPKHLTNSSPKHQSSQSKQQVAAPKAEGSTYSIPDCKITEEHLKCLPCRILTICDGQFYPGEVTKVILPGIYEVHIYKERCRKPQILCQEEVLTSAVSEVHCPEDMFLPAGTRVCAYWSQQYSCFYPGRVVSDSASGQVPIDFDDGDNGTIERTSVRFLPQDYPTVELPPNPLVGKRKRYNSTTSSEGQKNNTDATESEINLSGASDSDHKSRSSFDEEKESEPMKEKISDEERFPISNEKNSETDECSSSEETGPSEAIRSVLEGFFRSEQEEKERLKNVEKIHKRHKHHKHRDGSKVHKCKHNKHHRSHKHKRSSDDLSRLSGSKNMNNEKDSSRSIEKKDLGNRDSKEAEDSTGEASSEKSVLLNKSKSKIAAFLPEKHELWSWVGEGVKRGRALGPRGKGLKIFYKAIQRGNEIINTGDSAVFVSTGRPDRPFIGQIEQFWQCHMKKNMVVKIAWFYHPEEAIGSPDKLPYPGGVFKSSHFDHNDVQTISHKCEVLSLSEFRKKAEENSNFLDTVYENNDTYYLAGFYDPSNILLNLESEVSEELEKENKKDSK